jgi:hypothetical protein
MRRGGADLKYSHPVKQLCSVRKLPASNRPQISMFIDPAILPAFIDPALGL